MDLENKCSMMGHSSTCLIVKISFSIANKCLFSFISTVVRLNHRWFMSFSLISIYMWIYIYIKKVCADGTPSDICLVVLLSSKKKRKRRQGNARRT